MTPIALSLMIVAGVVVPPPVQYAGVDAARAKSVHKALVAALGEGALAIGIEEPRPEPPPPLPPELRALKEKAEAAYDEADLAAAADAGRKLVSGIEEQLEKLGDVAPLVDARLSLASAYLSLEEGLLARAELDAVARMRPALDLDLKRWPPVLVEAFDAAKARVATEPGAEVSLKVTPPGAVVFVDGVRVGTSPATISLRKGPHLVWMDATAHRSKVRRVVVEAGSKSMLDDTLVAEPMAVTLSALAAELSKAGRREEGLSLARALARDAGAEQALVSAITKAQDGDVLLVALVDAKDVRAAAITLPPGNVDEVVRQTLATFESRLSDATREALALDFEARLLGASPAQPVVSVEEQSLLTSPWTWAAVGGGVLVAAATATIAALVLTQPVVEQGPAETRVLVVTVE